MCDFKKSHPDDTGKANSELFGGIRFISPLLTLSRADTGPLINAQAPLFFLWKKIQMWREKGEIFIKPGTIVCVYHRSSLKIATEMRVIIGNKNSDGRLISIMISPRAPARQRGEGWVWGCARVWEILPALLKHLKHANNH